MMSGLANLHPMTEALGNAISLSSGPQPDLPSPYWDLEGLHIFRCTIPTNNEDYV